MSKQEPMPESREFPIDDITEFAYAKSADMKEETFFTVLGTAVVYLRQLLANIKDLEAENKRLREVEKHAIELAQENMNGYCRYAPARKILLLCGRCPECGNKIVGDCMVCKLANDALSKDKEQNAGNAVSK